jgi:Tfp pilus assembly protein PilE
MLNLRKPQIQLLATADRRPERGFTLVEILVSSAVTLIIVGALAGLAQITGRGTIQTREKAQAQSAIDSDITSIKDRAHRFHCCATACTSNLSLSCSGAITGSAIGSTDFYRPAAGSASETTLNAACSARTLASTLSSEIPANAALSRTIDIDSDSATAHRLKITYSAAGNTERVVFVVPTVAAFCPET